MPAASRRPIMDLRSVIAARQPLAVEEAPFQALRLETKRFLRCLTLWADGHKNELVEQEEVHVRTIQDGTQEVRKLKGEIEEQRTLVENLVATMNSQQFDLQKNQEAVSEQRARRQKQQNTLTLINKEAQEVKASIARLRAAHEADERILRDQMVRVAPEFLEYERLLALRIIPVRADILRFCFDHIDSANLEREFTFIVDVSHEAYRVPSSDPQLSTLPTIVDALNQDRDFFKFLKRVRLSFEEYVREERG